LRAPNDLVAKSPLWWLILLVPVAILAASAQSNWMLLAAGFRVFNLPSESMELTISKDDLIIVDLWRYRQSRPLPMQILVFSHAFVREKLKESYSEIGRPSIDPELLLRILLIGYLYGITSERKLVEELRMHLAWRWFTGLGFDQEIPHHSTFSKNRHGRFQESKLFEQLFEEIVRQGVEVGLVQGDNLSVDGSFVEANASKESRIPREQLAEAAQVNQTVRQYLGELEKQNPTEEPVA
jgi:transposase